MSRSRHIKHNDGIETWKPISKQAGVWMGDMQTSNSRKYVKRMTNRYLRRQRKKQWAEDKEE